MLFQVPQNSQSHPRHQIEYLIQQLHTRQLMLAYLYQANRGFRLHIDFEVQELLHAVYFLLLKDQCGLDQRHGLYHEKLQIDDGYYFEACFLPYGSALVLGLS
jgi:hypothetical protein